MRKFMRKPIKRRCAKTNANDAAESRGGITSQPHDVLEELPVNRPSFLQHRIDHQGRVGLSAAFQFQAVSTGDRANFLESLSEQRPVLEKGVEQGAPVWTGGPWVSGAPVQGLFSGGEVQKREQGITRQIYTVGDPWQQPSRRERIERLRGRPLPAEEVSKVRANAGSPRKNRRIGLAFV